MSLKMYNQWEMRFLQVLVSKEHYFEIQLYNFVGHIDRFLAYGNTIIVGHPDDKIEWIDSFIDTEVQNDYIDTVKKTIKKLDKSFKNDD